MRRVLIVDDEQNLRHMLQTLLKREGYEPVGVSSVDSALLELSDRSYEIVITDLRMPGKSGMELVDEIRRRNMATTVVVMTAYGSRDIAIEAMKHGAYDFIPKPFEPDQLRIVVNRASEKVRLTREAQKLERDRQRTLLDLDAEKSRIRTVLESLPNGVGVINSCMN